VEEVKNLILKKCSLGNWLYSFVLSVLVPTNSSRLAANTVERTTARSLILKKNYVVKILNEKCVNNLF
jgi:hypothetical protein